MTAAVNNIAVVPHRVVGGGWSLTERLYLGLNRLAALVLLVLLSPVMIVLAVLVRLDGGPAMFGHYRVGARGQLFRCLKFRSMAIDAEQRLKDLLEKDEAIRAEWALNQKLAHDPRITPIGRLLRKTSLDELPQLLNVLRGEMTLVGPRPITVNELQRYGRTKWHYLAVVPGMTGLWQVNGRNTTTYDHRVRLDEYYVTNRSMWLDMTILAKTVLVVLTRDGAG